MSKILDFKMFVDDSNYLGKGIIESILDYKFLNKIDSSLSVYNDFEDLRAIVNSEYAKYGISTIIYGRRGNEYYNGTEKIGRNELLELIKSKTGSELEIEPYLEENFTWE